MNRVFEKITLIQFFQSTLGKAILLILFLLPIIFFRPLLWKHICLALIMLTALPNYRFKILLIISPCFWIFTNFFRWDLLFNRYDQLGISKQILSSYFFKTCIIGCILVANILTIFLLKKASKHLNSIIFLVLIYAIIFYFNNFIIPPGRYAALTYTFTFIYCNFFWYIIFATTFDGNETNKTQSLLSMKPFWGPVGPLPIPGGITFLKRFETNTAEDFVKSQISAIKLIYWSLFIYLTTTIINNLIFKDHYGHSILTQVTDIAALNHYKIDTDEFLQNFKSQNNLDLKNILLLEVIFLLKSLRNLLNLRLVEFGIIVSIIRMCGFHIFRHVYKPFNAKDFSDFIGRWYYYYNQIIMIFFFVPIHRALSSLKSVRLHRFFSIFLSIFFMGMIHQTLRLITVFSHTDRNIYETDSINYYVALSLTLAISEITKQLQKKFNLIFLILLFSIIFQALYLFLFFGLNDSETATTKLLAIISLV